MAKPLRALIVEDSDDDVLLIAWELKRGGYAPTYEIVESRDEMEKALDHGGWEIIVSDYSMPRFSGLEALALVQARGLDLPFIIVSGNIGEDVAVDAMKAGAHDYVMKRNLSRLVPAIERELREAAVRRARTRAEQELRENEARFRAIASNIPGTVYQFAVSPRVAGAFTFVSENCSRLLGVSATELCGDPGLFQTLLVDADTDAYAAALQRSMRDLSDINWEGRVRIPTSDEIKWINLRSSPRKVDDNTVLWEGVMWNITASKLAEIEIRRSREQLVELSSHIQKVKEHERANIAREIHDDIGGNLTAIKFDLHWFAKSMPTDLGPLHDKVRAMERLVDRTMETTQRISQNLRPGILDLGLIAAIEWQADEFSARMGVACEVNCVEDDDVQLDPDISVAVFRIFQETLTNVSKYAGATQVDVRLSIQDGLVELEVSDDGKGIALQDMSKSGSFGIRGMLERARSLGGSVDIAGTPGAGTRVLVRIPVGPCAREPAGEQAQFPFDTDQGNNEK